MDYTAIVAIVGLVVFITVKDWLAHKERMNMERIKKASTLSEVEYILGNEEEEDEEPKLVDLENIPDGVIPEGPE